MGIDQSNDYDSKFNPKSYLKQGMTIEEVKCIRRSYLNLNPDEDGHLDIIFRASSLCDTLIKMDIQTQKECQRNMRMLMKCKVYQKNFKGNIKLHLMNIIKLWLKFT